MKLYKLTDQDGYTRRWESNGTLWGENVSHAASCCGTELCTAQVIHAYESPLVAVFMNPIHADIKNPVIWECEGEPVAWQGQLKCGCKSLTTLRKIALPEITMERRTEIAIRLVLTFYKDAAFKKWADAWLDGSDRSGAAAWAAARAAAWAAAWAAWAAARAAVAAAEAAKAAAWAAAVAARAAADLDLHAMIKSVLEKSNDPA